MGTESMIEIISVIVSVLSIAVSVLLVIIQINNNAKEQLKASLAQNRPLLIASMYGRMDLQGNEKKRLNFTRYVAKTPAYKEALAEQETGQTKEHVFLRVRNESDNHAHGVKVRLQTRNCETGACFTQECTINIIASFCEYLFFVPQEHLRNGYVDEYRVVVSYSSISGENIEYTCEFDRKYAGKVRNLYRGVYPLKRKKKMDTFSVEILSDPIETIEK